MKDTVQVTAGGWALVEVVTDNPGIWMLHCHMQQHIMEGMNMWFKVGDRFPSTPEGFPTCSLETNVDITEDGFESLLQNSEPWPFVGSSSTTTNVLTFLVALVYLK